MMARRLDLVRYYLGRIGRSGGVGVLLLLVSMFAWIAVVQPKQQKLAEIMEANERMHQAVITRKEEFERQSDRTALLPNLAPEAAAALGRLYEAAATSKLELVQGEYRLVVIKDAPLKRYQLMLPVYGSYPELRSFLTKSLNQELALSLNAIQLRRDVIESTDLDGVLNFTLFLEDLP
jgi:PHD/YefM family antitoxin component YafN of YafNO toxin-antitoxin module